MKAELLVRTRLVPGVEITNELAGSTQAILAVRPQVWDHLLKTVIPIDSVMVYDNDTVDLTT